MIFTEENARLFFRRLADEDRRLREELRPTSEFILAQVVALLGKEIEWKEGRSERARLLASHVGAREGSVKEKEHGLEAAAWYVEGNSRLTRALFKSWLFQVVFAPAEGSAGR